MSTIRPILSKSARILATAGVAAAIAIGGIAAVSTDQAQAFVPDNEVASGQEWQDELEQTWAGIAEDYAPRVTTLPDGTQVQRTPTDTSHFQMYYINGGNLSYNTRFLDADNRGCNACHDDLAATLANMDFFHLELDNGLGVTTTVDHCRLCHDYGQGYVDKTQQLGNLIHGIHNKSGIANNCMSCHAATSDGEGMVMWDDVKHDIMQGIGSVSDVEGEFSYDQNVTTDMFDASWFYGAASMDGIANAYAGVPIDESVIDTWEITVDGLVNEPYTATLADLIAEAPSETFIATLECIMNPIGGDAIANVEFTGIPISWLLEKAGGMQDGVTAIMSYAPDGWGRSSLIEKYEDTGGYLVYKANGEYLDWQNGFPCMTVWPGQGIPASIRWCCEISPVDTPVDQMKFWDGWTIDGDGDGVNEHNGGHPYTEAAAAENVTPINNPTAFFTYLKEGQIISADEPYTFEGVAYSTIDQIASVEFSLDGGNTWTAYDTSDSDRTKWVYFNWTTQLDPGAYVVSVRACTASGQYTYKSNDVLVNVQ